MNEHCILRLHNKLNSADCPHDLLTCWRLRARRQLLASHERCVASQSCALEARNVEPGDPERQPVVRVRGLWHLRTPNASCVLETLRGVDLQAYDGAVTAVVGPRHAGKSSLVAVLLGLEEPSAGSISVDGHVLFLSLSLSQQYRPSSLAANTVVHHQLMCDLVRRVQEIERGADRSWALQKMGFTLEQNHFYECLDTEQHLYLIGRMRGISEELIRSQAGVALRCLLFASLRVPTHLEFGVMLPLQVTELLLETNLYSHRTTRPNGLTKWFARRVQLAMALIGNTSVLVLDEPTRCPGPPARPTPQGSTARGEAVAVEHRIHMICSYVALRASRNCDQTQRRDLWEILRRRRQGRVVLMTTPRFDEADFVAGAEATRLDAQHTARRSQLLAARRAQYRTPYCTVPHRTHSNARRHEGDTERRSRLVRRLLRVAAHTPRTRLHSDVRCDSDRFCVLLCVQYGSVV